MMAESGDSSLDTPAYQCPGCGEPVHATPGEVARLIDCPACEERFLIPALDGSTDIPDEPGPSEEEKAASAASELNGLRMRHVVVARRAAMRSGTYAIVGAVCCLMAAVKLGIMTVQEVREAGWRFPPIAYVLFGMAGCYGAVYFMGRALYWRRESQGGKIPDPETPPDFSALSDGSQHARNLEDLR